MRPFTSYLTDREDTGKNRYLAAFLLACLVAAAIFIPFMIQDQGYFFYFGDYNVQDIPFYQHAHEMVRSGNWNWDFGTDLGANFIGSYSFYMLGSPFFWLMLPFPNWMIPYLMGPMFILKFGVCGLTAYCYIARFLRNKNFALLGSLLYAFSGFTVYNVFFNHFVDVVALFPLLLIGLEMYVVDGKKGFFAVAVAINMMVNYFFFVGQAVFLLIYFLCRLPSPHFCIKKRVFFGLAFETVLGCLGGMIIFLPGILAITGNPRVDNFLYGHDLLFYADTQRYGGILSSLFFMPEVPSRPNFFPQEWAKWSSLSAWLPLFSVTGVLAFFGNTGKNFVKRVLSVCLVMALVPVLNSAFYAFNSSYYARWFYMPVLLMALASVKVLEDRGASYRRPILITAVGVGFFTLIGLVPTQDGDKVKIGAEAMPDRFFMWVLVSVISLLLFYLLIYHLRPRGMFFRPEAGAGALVRGGGGVQPDPLRLRAQPLVRAGLHERHRPGRQRGGGHTARLGKRRLFPQRLLCGHGQFGHVLEHPHHPVLSHGGADLGDRVLRVPGHHPGRALVAAGGAVRAAATAVGKIPLRRSDFCPVDAAVGAHRLFAV